MLHYHTWLIISQANENALLIVLGSSAILHTITGALFLVQMPHGGIIGPVLIHKAVGC